jgi:hypothetical protein
MMSYQAGHPMIRQSHSADMIRVKMNGQLLSVKLSLDLKKLLLMESILFLIGMEIAFSSEKKRISFLIYISMI